jgi:dGTPase
MNIREMLEKIEYDTLAPRAAKSAETRGRDHPEPEDDLRPSYQRDRDRIIHCKAFRRLKHKTQVFLAPEGDHYRTRLTHVLEVTQIGRTIAKSLRLNEVLTEAIGLGHDLGHSAFGHAGESALNKLVKGGFDHYRQSVRVVEVLENDGKGLNLTIEVRDGILKHSKGEKGELLRKRPRSRALTLEGDIVRISDIIAYVNHDIDDGIRAGLLMENDIPKDIRTTLGRTGSARIDRMVRDVIASTLACDYEAISMSPEVLQALEELRTFMFQNMYLIPTVRSEFEKAQKTLTALFQPARRTDRAAGHRLHRRDDRPLRDQPLREVVRPPRLGVIVAPNEKRSVHRSVNQRLEGKGYLRPLFPARRAEFTASRRSLPALNRTFLDAGMVIFSLVRGFRPSRARRWLMLKLPSPGMAQRSPRTAESEM